MKSVSSSDCGALKDASIRWKDVIVLLGYKINCAIYSHIFGFAGLHDVAAAIFLNIL